MPPQILPTPLLREDSKKRGRETDYEAGEPERIDRDCATRCTECGRPRQSFSSLIEERLHVRGRAILQRDEGEKLNGRLRVVGLEEEDGKQKERRDDGREETCL